MVRRSDGEALSRRRRGHEALDGSGASDHRRPQHRRLRPRGDDVLRAVFAPGPERPYRACGYTPMVELLRYLEENGFTPYIASGGDRDFMRPIASHIYGIPPERIIGSSQALDFQEREDGNDVLYKSEMEFFDDGPTKPVRIWSRIGRRPSWPEATPTGTSRCCASPTTRAPSTEDAASPRRCRAGVRLHGGGGGRLGPSGREGLDRRQHQERLVASVCRLTPGLDVRSFLFAVRARWRSPP